MIAQGKTCSHALSGTRHGMAMPVEPRPFSGLLHSAGELLVAPWFHHDGREATTTIWLSAPHTLPPRHLAAPRLLRRTSPYPAQETQPIEPILIPKLRIRLAEFPYATLFYAPETAHLGDLMRIRYG